VSLGALIGILVTGIFSDDAWWIGEGFSDGNPIVIRARESLPAQPDREIYRHLLIVSWKYSPKPSGMPETQVHSAMCAFEDAVEATVEKAGTGVQAASITGNGSKEWRYYTYDPGEFMSQLNDALTGQPAHPLDIQMFDDPDWDALGELIEGRA
jgi:hypothetical protein